MRPTIPLILEPEELVALKSQPDILIVDLSAEPGYMESHIEAAVHIHPAELVSGVQPATGKLPGIDRLETLFSRIGYHPGQHIVACDDEGGGWAGRFIWTLDVIGHQHMSYLNGGMHAWTALHLPTTAEVPRISPTTANITINTHVIATKAEVLASLDNPDTVIWDARAPDEYAGTRKTARRSGHIPGAVNLEWTRAMDLSRQLRIRTDIVELLASVGISCDKKIITHCQTHHRSGFTYLIGKSLGLDIRAYDGSWSEWGNDPDTPIETG